ncbi:MAG: hypothetical protein JXR46_03550 [Calditrichaceae bacterium]|nr:hypothetical protein [Calditrichaceae bacterium]MBN2708099.1 hypothetical protein [Calditrichaceae bacterium]RQV94861.1 MAG: hypothetical protein EH224_09190 [Calditrichota bacterium]
MSRILTFCVVIVLVLSVSCAHQTIAGKWKGQMENPMGTMELTYIFNVEGDSLSGTVTSQMGELPLLNGKTSGKEFSFDISFNQMNITNQGVLQGDSISLKVPGPGGESMKLILTRVSEE